MNVTEPKFSKRLGEEIYPYTVEFIEWCKTSTQLERDNFLQESYEEEIDEWKKIIKKNYEEYEGEPLNDPKRLDEILENSSKKWLAETHKGYFSDRIETLRKDKTIEADENKLFSLEEEEVIACQMNSFLHRFSKVLNEDALNNMKQQEAEDYIIRFEKCYAAQSALSSRRETIKHLINMGGSPFMHSEYYSKKENMEKYMMEEDDLEQEKLQDLNKLLSKKANRNSINLVFSSFLYKKRMEKKHWHYKGSFELLESFESSEDIYKIERRLPGSAYSGKRTN
jgi:hypothetical protein